MPEIRENAKPAPAGPHVANEEERDRRRTAIGGPTCGHTRRAAMRLLSVCALAAPAALRSHAARAIMGWCRRDPIVMIGDLTVDIVLFSFSEMDELATGASKLVITVPAVSP